MQVCPPRSSCAEIHLRGGLLPVAVPFPDNTRGAVCRLAADLPVGRWIEVLPSIRVNGFYYGRKFTYLLHRSLEAEKEAKAGLIPPEEADAIRKAFYEEVDILAEKIKKQRGKETPTS